MAVGPLAPQLVPQQHGSGAILRSMVSHPQLLSPRSTFVDACVRTAARRSTPHRVPVTRCMRHQPTTASPAWLALHALTVCPQCVKSPVCCWQFLQQETRYILKKAHMSPVDLRYANAPGHHMPASLLDVGLNCS